MRQLLCVLALLPGLAQIASAQALPTNASDPSGALTAASLVASASASAPLNASAPSNATVSALLQKKFGVAKEKAARISQAVTTAAEKYSLPPAVLLAIISIESRFREKARGANGATGLMQVVPSAHRNLLRNGKDLTDPEFNIEVGSSILYGYQRAAGGNLDAAMKNYGGSKAYAEKIRLRATEFSRVLDTSAPGARNDEDVQAAIGMSPAASATMAFSAAATAAQAQNVAASGAR